MNKVWKGLLAAAATLGLVFGSLQFASADRPMTHVNEPVVPIDAVSLWVYSYTDPTTGTSITTKADGTQTQTRCDGTYQAPRWNMLRVETFVMPQGGQTPSVHWNEIISAGRIAPHNGQLAVDFYVQWRHSNVRPHGHLNFGTGFESSENGIQLARYPAGTKLWVKHTLITDGGQRFEHTCKWIQG